MQNALRQETATRAWSLTGPYGSGKSAFALLLASYSRAETKPRDNARQYLRKNDEELAAAFFDRGGPFAKKSKRLLPVLVTGSRQSLDKALAGSLAKTLSSATCQGTPP